MSSSKVTTRNHASLKRKADIIDASTVLNGSDVPRQDAAFQIKRYHAASDLDVSQSRHSADGTVEDGDREDDADESNPDRKTYTSVEAGTLDTLPPSAAKQTKVEYEREQKRLKQNRQCLQATKPGSSQRAKLVSQSQPCRLWFEKHIKAWTIHDIRSRRSDIKDAVMAYLDEYPPPPASPRKHEEDEDEEGDPPYRMTLGALHFMMSQYDEHFFQGRFIDYVQDRQQTTFRLDFGNRKTEFKKGWAGLCVVDGNKATISIHPGLNDLQFQRATSTDGEEGELQGEEINGLLCYDVIDCVQAVLEHELIHLLMLVCLRQMRASHGKVFQSLAKSLFGHTLYTHTIGHGHGRERIAREADRARKFERWQLKDVIWYGRRFGMIVVKNHDHIVVIHADGSLVERVPFWEAQLVRPPRSKDGPAISSSSSEDDEENAVDDSKNITKDMKRRQHPPPPLPHHNEWQQLVEWCELFLAVKQQVKKGQMVSWRVKKTQELNVGKVLGKRAAQVQVMVTRTRASILIPYHCVILSDNSPQPSASSSSSDSHRDHRRSTHASRHREPLPTPDVIEEEEMGDAQDDDPQDDDAQEGDYEGDQDNHDEHLYNPSPPPSPPAAASRIFHLK